MISRIQIPKIQGADELFTEPYLNYLIHLHDKFSDQIQILRKERLNNLQKAHEHGLETLKLPISEINTQDWHVDTVPEDLKQPGIEISGPSSIASMMINALNPGPEGERAVGYLDDDEDSGGHSLQDTINSAINRLSAINKSLEVVDSNRNRHYKLQPGNLPFFMHRERGLHLDEHEIKIDGSPISATLLGTSLTIFYCGQAQFKNNLGVYFYLPKLESVNEAKLYKQIFDESKKLDLYIFGAGHIGQSLINKTEFLNFNTYLIDSREEFLSQNNFKHINYLLSKKPWDITRRLKGNSIYVIVTHSHDYDFKIINEILRLKKFEFLGLIGSSTKFQRFKSRLIKLGHKNQMLNKIECPIGLKNISSKKPAEIAISIIGRILEFRTSLDKISKNDKDLLVKVNEQ